MKKKFKEKAPSVIEKIKMAQADAEARAKARREEIRSKNKGTEILKMKDILTNNLSDQVIAEINRPDK